MSESHFPRVGIYFEPSIKKRSVNQYVISGIKQFAEVTEIDLLKPIPDQGPFDCVLHKVTKEINDDDPRLSEAAYSFHKYLRDHAEILAIDPPQKVEAMANRIMLHEILRDFSVAFQASLQDKITVSFPKSAVFSSSKGSISESFLNEENLTYPLIIKPAKSCGSHFSHRLAIVSSFDQLRESIHSFYSKSSSTETSSTKSLLEDSILLQQAVDHIPYVFKIYCIWGEGLFQKIEPSLPPEALKKPEKAFVFDDQVDFEASQSEKPPQNLPLPLLQAVANELYQRLGIQIFGFDLLLDRTSPNQFYLVDVNYFPSFKQINEAPELIVKHVRRRLSEHIAKRK